MGTTRPLSSRRPRQEPRLELAEHGLAELPVPALVVDADARVRFVNGAARRLFDEADGLEGEHVRALARRLQRWDGGAAEERDLPPLAALDGHEEVERRFVLAAGPSCGAVVDVRARRITGDDGGVVGATTSLVVLSRWSDDEGGLGRFEIVFRRFAERVPDAVAIHEDGRVLYVNDAAVKALGFERADELVGRPVLDFVAPRDRPRITERMRELYEERVAVPRQEEMLLDRRGTEVPASITALPFPTRAGRGVVVVAQSLVAEKRAAAERARLAEHIRAQLETFEEMVRVAPIGIALLRGSDLVFEVVNGAFQAFAPGVPLEGKRFADAAPDLPDLREQLERVLETGEPLVATDAPLQIRRRADGPLERAWFAYAAVRARCPGGAGVLALVVETSEQVLARRRIEQLAEQNRRGAAELRAVLDNMVEGVLVLDTDLRVKMANASARKVIEEAGQPMFDQMTNEGLRALRLRKMDGARVALEDTVSYRVVRTGKPDREDYLIGPGDARHQRVIRVSVSPIRDERGVIGAVAVLTDMTAEAQVERMKSQFIRVAAHELKTPVTVMKGYAEALLRPRVGPPSRRALEAIGRGADRIDRIVRDLLDISAFETGVVTLAHRRFRLDDMVREEAALVGSRAPEHRIDVETVATTVVGDRARLAQVVSNLLENAIRYSPERGRIVVRVERREGEALVSVTDEGVGIPEAKKARIFERFYRAHADTQHDYGGMGVGLYIARHIVERHGGHVGFESIEGKGSRFWFTLPVSEP